MGDVAGDVVRLGLLLTLLGFALWVGGAFVAAWVGGEKGRDPIAWFVLAFFLSPLVALIALGAVPARRPARAARGVARPAAARPVVEDPAVAAARLVNGARQDKETARWDVATFAVTSTRRPW
ncbi:MAG TPA: hypothetical protein VIG37_16410 [Methylomirabilota bacterium]|jgi:hypothetical protein